MTRLVVALVCSLMISTLSFAGQTKTDLVVDHVRVRMSVSYVKFSGCSRYSRIYLNSEYEKAMYSTALAAGMSGKKVDVEFDGSDCSAKELELIYIDVNF